MSRPNLEILAYEPTDLGPLCLRRRELLSSAVVHVEPVGFFNHHVDEERTDGLFFRMDGSIVGGGP